MCDERTARRVFRAWRLRIGKNTKKRARARALALKRLQDVVTQAVLEAKVVVKFQAKIRSKLRGQLLGKRRQARAVQLRLAEMYVR